MAQLHVRFANVETIGALGLAIALIGAAPTPAHALLVQGTINVQPIIVGDANDDLCFNVPPSSLPLCAPALITFSLRPNRPNTFQYSFEWHSGPPENRDIFGDSNFISDVEQIFGPPLFVTRSFSNSWDGTNLAVDLHINEEFAQVDAEQIVQFDTTPGAPGAWFERVEDYCCFFSDFTTISSDLNVVPEPPPLLMLLTALAAFFGVAELRRLAGTLRPGRQ